jgi:CubicO group peptidase (beta-lactamase class C family)
VRPYGIIGIALLGAVIASGWIFYRPDLAIRAGTMVVSQTLCGNVLISGLDARRVMVEDLEPQRGVGKLLKRVRYTIDRARRQVTATWAGHFESVATCPVSPSFTEPPAVAPLSAGLSAALDRAFAEPAQAPYRHVRAIVVMRDGKIMGERYADGISPDTPLIAYSVSKSVINAFIGILVRQGKLNVFARAPVGAWQSAGDPRHNITLDQLLRMTSGLTLEEGDNGFDPVSRMFLQPDMAGFAERAGLKAQPGTRWEYTSGNTLIASAIVRDAVGGTADDVLRFAHRELFDPVGMHHVVMEFDEAGTPVGSTRIYASARDWARFGELYRNDGVLDDKRILPEGWVAYSAKPTLDSDYGSGFWVNAGQAEHARGRVEAGMPRTSFFASGVFGQRVVIVPSRRLVIVRFGATIDPPDFDIHGLTRLVRDVIQIP